MNKFFLGFLGCLAAGAAQAQSWSGPYGGLALGYFDSKSTWTTTQLGGGAAVICPPVCNPPLEEDLGARGVQFSAHLGNNWALGRSGFAGIEIGAGKTNASKTLDRTPGFAASADDRIKVDYDWNVSLAARAGFAAGPLAFYGLAGPSWQSVSIRYDCPGTAASWCVSGSQSARRSDARFGWVAGAGAEWRFQPRWSARLDFRYAQYGDKDYTFFADTPTDTVFATVSLQTMVLSLGASYHF